MTDYNDMFIMMIILAWSVNKKHISLLHQGLNLNFKRFMGYDPDMLLFHSSFTK
jgi:hypothetical protein